MCSVNRDQLKKLERDLWAAADKLRANSDLKASEYSTPVLGLIFLKFADNKYRQHEDTILAEYSKLKGTRRERSLQDIAIEKCGFALGPQARYDYLLNLPEKEDIPKAIRSAMASIEASKPELLGVLPQQEYDRFSGNPQNRSIPKALLKLFSDIPLDASGDVFGQIYEYFLGNFAMSEGQGGGEFFTPRSVVRLMVEIIEPHGGKVFDPACGSGGMFVQSAQFIEQHRKDAAHDLDVYVYGTEKTLETVKLAKMNLAVNGLRGEVKQANAYSEDPFGAFGNFDYVLANPPFNVDDVPLDQVEHDKRFNTYGVPRNKSKPAGAKGKDKAEQKAQETVPNANYLWINLFATSLKPGGRAALVMANSASDARHSEAEIRRTLVQNNLIYGMLTLPSNLFYTVTLPATLWFFDKGKADDRVLFIDARNVFTQIDRAHRELSDAQTQNLAIIPRLHKGRRDEFVALVDGYFRSGLQKLQASHATLPALAERLRAVLGEDAAEAPEATAAGLLAVDNLLAQWVQLEPLAKAQQAFFAAHSGTEVDVRNKAQQVLSATYAPFFEQLHASLKALDKAIRHGDKRKAEAAKAAGKRGGGNRQSKVMKESLQALHDEVKLAESDFGHIEWLQQRFPKAAYEDVTGLCKLATQAEIEEQDWSLNPGRYVGVVIEEDGKTEEEFLDSLSSAHDELAALASEASALHDAIAQHVEALVNNAPVA